jgi:hypothetical protein
VRASVASTVSETESGAETGTESETETETEAGAETESETETEAETEAGTETETETEAEAGTETEPYGLLPGAVPPCLTRPGRIPIHSGSHQSGSASLWIDPESTKEFMVSYITLAQQP